MNKIIMSLFFILFSVAILQAQSSANARSTAPVITKGYYSIHKNADKLNHSDHLVSIEAACNPTAATQPLKGYFSMSKHHRKIYKSGVSFIAKKPERPVSSKGYYNMGTQAYEVKNNPQKLDVPTFEADSIYAVAK